MVAKYKKVSLVNLQERINSSDNWSDLLRSFGLKPGSGNHRGIKSYVEDNNLNVDHFCGNLKQIRSMVSNKKLPLDAILVENSDYRNTGSLKRRLLKETNMVNECSICGQQPWFNGNILIMVLDHINGNNRDNRITNLRLVCPNCNSQLSTSYGRKR